MQTVLLFRPWQLLLFLVAPTLVAALLLARTRRFIRLRNARKQTANHNRCKCGYLLENLTVVRCPECGRVPGFEVTAEQLGLTREQLERAFEAKARRENSA